MKFIYLNLGIIYMIMMKKEVKKMELKMIGSEEIKRFGRELNYYLLQAGG